MTPKTIGKILVGCAIILITLLIFVKNDTDKKDVFLCKAVEVDPTIDMEHCPAHTSNTSWLLMTGFGIAFAIIVSGIYLMHPTKIPKEKTTYKTIDITTLTDDEQTIYAHLKSKDGSSYQSDLIKHTKFSKVRMTRTLDKLEHKKVIERKRRGMTNIIVLQ